VTKTNILLWVIKENQATMVGKVTDGRLWVVAHIL